MLLSPGFSFTNVYGVLEDYYTYRKVGGPWFQGDVATSLLLIIAADAGADAGVAGVAGVAVVAVVAVAVVAAVVAAAS